MEERPPTKLNHKEWRKIAKKERRRRVRQKAARVQDSAEKQLRAALERDPDYLNWRAEQEKLEKEKEAREREEHAEREKLWLEEEERAQKEWQIHQEQKAKEEQQKREQQEKIMEEFEAKQEVFRKKKEKEKRKHEEQVRQQEQLQKEIDDYIDNGTKTPEALRKVVDSQPSKELCPFFTKTGACRFGDACSKNHRRVFLSKVIMVPGFYSHFSLEKNSAEYDTDVALEFEHSETWHHFCDFFEDVITVLETFGKIRTLKCCRNVEVHLRGNLYVEYYTEREAARAWRNLKGRWYASKQLNCEFVNLTSWRSAICGMSKCPKGRRACNFFHTFRNPHDKYGIESPPRWAKVTPRDLSNREENPKRSKRSKSTWEESARDDGREERCWRWSESPEIELIHRSKDSERKRSDSTERGRSSQKSSRDRRHEQSERSSVRSFRSTSSEKYRRSSNKKAYDDEVQDEKDTADESPPKKHRKKSKKRNNSKSSYDSPRTKHQEYEKS